MNSLNNHSIETGGATNQHGQSRTILKSLLGAVTVLAVVNVNAANLTISSKLNPGIFTPVPIPAAKPIVYAAKFVCGPQTTPATGIGQTVSYAALQPGNYATALNVLPFVEDRLGIEVHASMDGNPLNPLVRRFPFTRALNTYTVTCEDILDGFGVSVSNEAYEGFLYIERSKPDLEVQAVYTYASRDQFSDWLGVDTNGNVVENPEVNLISIGGAGGLGLGASIDVERVEPIDRSGL